MYPDLRSQLCAVRYDFRNGKILIEPKDEIKQRIGRSPDDADCYVMGVCAAKRVKSTIQFVNTANHNPYDDGYNVLTRGMRRTG
jgi:hypothetical protein